MFSKKPKQKSNAISALEKRICDLEKPYKFGLGQKVIDNSFMATGNNIIVDKRHDYENDYNSLSSNFMFISHNLSDNFITGKYNRINRYLVYISDSNESLWFSEVSLTLNNKKK